MFNDYGGWMWAFIDILLVAILGGGMVYGIMQWRRFKRMRPEVKAQRDAATERLFRKEGPSRG